jgi:NAD(P)H-hydrate repair Nnr-like enzyme with NAD(P)H-hydrate dehydratase domain
MIFYSLTCKPVVIDADGGTNYPKYEDWRDEVTVTSLDTSNNKQNEHFYSLTNSNYLQLTST